jgi:hypothetical protein
VCVCVCVCIPLTTHTHTQGGGEREEREIFEVLEGQSRVVVADWDSQKKVLFVALVEFNLV